MGDTLGKRCFGLSVFLLLVVNLCWTGDTAVLLAASISIDSLEGPTTSWNLGETDSTIHVLEHARVRHPVHSGRWAEKFYLTSAGGSFAYVTTPIEMASVIEELSFSLWIRADRTGMQLAARVVLPRSIDPDTGKALTLKVYGDSYQNVGRWQQLFLEQVLQKVRRQTRIAQSGHSGKVDFREAYVDRIMINLHGGNGKTSAYIDDLTIHGLISQKNKSLISADQLAPIDLLFDPKPRPNKNQFGPAVPRVIQYQGEPFAFLQNLGFNGILLPSPPTEQQRRDASKHHLWLLAPKRNMTGVVSGQSQTDVPVRIYGTLIWYAPNDGESPARQNVKETNNEKSQITLAEEPFKIEKIRTQISANSAYPLPLQKRFDSVPSPRVDLCYWEIREQVFRTIAGGKQRFLFSSRQPLNGSQPSAQRRSKALRLILMELNILAPFISGHVAAQSFDGRDTDIQTTLLTKHRSALLISKTARIHGTFLSRPITETYEVTVPHIAATSRVFFIRPFDLRPAHRLRVAGGVRVTLQGIDQITAILFTNQLSQIRRTAKQIVDVRDEAHEVFFWLLKEEQRLHRTTCEYLQGMEFSSLKGKVFLKTVKKNALLSGDDSRRVAQREIGYSLGRLQQIRAMQWDIWHRVADTIGPPTRHPALARFDTLPAAITWADVLSQQTLGSDLLGGNQPDQSAGDHADWKVVDALKLNPQNRFEVLRQSNKEKTTVHVWSQQKMTKSGSNLPLTIESPLMHLPPGTPYLIQADIMVTSPENGDINRALIFDSGEGPAMAQALGSGKNLQQCILYRRSPPTGNFSVNIAVRGATEVWVKNITVCPLLEKTDIPKDGEPAILASPSGH